jgi:aminoglycoside 6'-N-acetyltransferase I
MIKEATEEDALILAELAVQMWHSHTISELQAEFINLICSENAVCFIKYINNKAIGFAQCQLRNDYVEGTSTSPVGYLEGIFIQEEYRHNGYARELLLKCEKWAKEKQCTEFASDCELDNEMSLKFHLSMGFEEANRIICFRKDICECE